MENLFVQLTNLFQVLQGLVLSSHYRGHTTKSGFLQLLTSVQTVAKLDETNIILGHVLNQVASSVDLTQSQLVMILNNNKKYE